MSESVRPHRWQPTRVLCPWDSQGKNTGVGCHFFLQCRKVKSKSEVAQSCPTLSDPMDCSPPGSSIHGIFQARVILSRWWIFLYLHDSGSIFALASIVECVLARIQQKFLLHISILKEILLGREVENPKHLNKYWAENN